MASKVTESIYLHDFMKRQGGFTVEDETASREAPDFLLRDNEGILGFEVTQLFRDDAPSGSPSRAAEGRRRTFLQRVALAYYQAHGLPIRVVATLADRPSDVPIDIARLLCSSRPAEPWLSATVQSKTGAIYRITSLPDQLVAYANWDCTDNRVGAVGSIAAASVSACIRDKATKLTEYRRAATRVGLLIVVDNSFQSGMLRWYEPSRSMSLEGFDMVFLHLYPREVHRLG